MKLKLNKISTLLILKPELITSQKLIQNYIITHFTIYAQLTNT